MNARVSDSVSSDSLIRATSQSNMREYSAFASESRANAWRWWRRR